MNATHDPTPDAWYAAARHWTFRGHDLPYRDSGGDSHEAVLLIHGFPTCSWDWAPLWDRLVARYSRVIAPDMLGFGRAAKPRGHRYDLMEQADLHVALMQHCSVDTVQVVAHDYGVSVAQELLARGLDHSLPMTLRAVALLNGGLFPETHRARLVQKLLEGPLGSFISRLFGKKQFERSFTAVFGSASRPTQAELDGFWQLICLRHGNQLLHKLIHYMADRRQHRERWLLALRDSCVPVMLINGSADPVSGAHMVARYRELVRPRDPIIELPEIGHYPQVEAPTAVASAYHDFLQELP